MSKIFIVTGAVGFLGNNIIRALRNQFDGEIRALLLEHEDPSVLEPMNCKLYYGDITVPESLDAIFDVPPQTDLYVIHCAAYVYIKSAFNQRVYDVNVTGTMNVAEHVLERAGRLVYINSVHAIPEKPGHEQMSEISSFSIEDVSGQYAKTKAEAANRLLEMVDKRGLDAVIIQPAGLIGPNDFGPTHTTQMIIDYCNHKLTACVKGGYNFADVRDVANGIISACESGKAGECYILANRAVSVKTILDIISREFGVRKITTVLPMWFAKMTAPLSEIYYSILRQPPLYTKYSLYALCSNPNFTSAKAVKVLNYKARSIKDTLIDTVKWLSEHKYIKLNQPT